MTYRIRSGSKYLTMSGRWTNRLALAACFAMREQAATVARLMGGRAVRGNA